MDVVELIPPPIRILMEEDFGDFEPVPFAKHYLQILPELKS